MPSSPGRSCPEASGQEGGISAHSRFCFYVSEIFLVLVKVRNWERPSWDQSGTTLTQSLPKATGTCPPPAQFHVPEQKDKRTCPKSLHSPADFLSKPWAGWLGVRSKTPARSQGFGG